MFTTENAERREDAEGGERMDVGEEALNRVSGAVIGAAIEVHRILGPGLLESAYESCLHDELCSRGLRIERQVSLPIFYKGRRLDCSYRIDMIVERRVLVEIKAVEQVLTVHEAQVLSYLRLSGIPLGLLINFHCPTLRAGVRRLRLFQSSVGPSVSSSSSVPSVVNNPTTRR